MLPELHASANATTVACVVQQVYIIRSAATDADTRLRETRSGREKRDHADGVGAVERMMVEVDRGGGGGYGLWMMVVEGRGRCDEVELRGQAAVDVSGGSGGGDGGGGPHSPSSGGGGVVGGGGGAGIES